MYNRYIPQADGSYCRRVVNSEPKPTAPPCPTPPEPPCPPPANEPVCSQKPNREPKPAGDFLRNLFPHDLDTGDLLILMLLLLIAGECREDRNTALLALVLYLFL